MATPAQIEANRRNSQLSTGPRTDAGKSASSRNSTRTGLYAKSLLIDGEDPEELQALEQDYFDDCNPQGPRENALVLELLRCDWLQRRMDRVETQFWDSYTPHTTDHRGRRIPLPRTFSDSFLYYSEKFVLIQRRTTALSRAYHRALHDLQKVQASRQSPPPEPPPAPEPAEIGFVPPDPDPAPPLCVIGSVRQTESGGVDEVDETAGLDTGIVPDGGATVDDSRNVARPLCNTTEPEPA